MKFGAIASILAATLSTGGAIVGYWIFKPSTLEKYLQWKGFTVAKSDDEKLWKSIYEENKDSFDSVFSKSEKTEGWKVIRDYCVRVLKKQDYSSDIDKASKWCIDDVQTVKGQMVRDGIETKNLMTTDKQYKVAATFEASEPFWALANPSDDNLSSKAEAYKAWCDKSLESKPSKNLVQNVNNFCNNKGYTNFKQKLEKDKEYKVLASKDIEGKYEALKLDTFKSKTRRNILITIGGGEDKWEDSLVVKKDAWKVDKTKFTEKYKAYCKEKEEFDFSKDEIDYATLYGEYRWLCGKKNEVTG